MHLVVCDIGEYGHTAGMGGRESPQIRNHRATANKKRSPAPTGPFERAHQYLDSLLRHEPAEKADHRHVVGPTQPSSYYSADGSVRPEAVHIDAGRDDPRGTGGIERLRSVRLVHGLAERDPAGGSAHHATLKQTERGRILLDDVLEGRWHDAGSERRRRRHLRARGDVRFLPDVHDIPRTSEQRVEASLVAAQMRTAAKPDVQCVRRAGFISNRFECDLSQIAGQTRWRQRRHHPSPASLHRHLVREPAIGGNDVGMGDSYQSVQGSRFKVQGSRFRVQGSRFRVQGSRFRVGDSYGCGAIRRRFHVWRV